jgi:hypothetical protein
MLKADFLSIDGLQSFVYTDAATAGNTTQTVDNARITFTEVKSFGEAAVKGYQISGVSLTFPVDSVTVTPKLGDYVAVDGSTYEVTKADKATAQTRWRLMAERAYLEADWVSTVILKRFTLSTDVAGAVTESSYAIGSYSAAVMQEDDVADMINRLGVKGDKQAITFFMEQTVAVLPMDFITYSGRDYRVTMIGDEGRVGRLKKVRTELYA